MTLNGKLVKIEENARNSNRDGFLIMLWKFIWKKNLCVFTFTFFCFNTPNREWKKRRKQTHTHKTFNI